MPDDYDDIVAAALPGGKTSSKQRNVDYRSLYQDVGQKYGLDPDLLYNQAKHESVNFNPYFVYGPGRSPKGAAGLAQFMPDTARQYGLYVGKGRDDRFDPVKSADAHGRLMRDLMARYGDPQLALAAYNSGTNKTAEQARRAMNRIPETRNYVAAISPSDPYDDVIQAAVPRQSSQKAATVDPYDDVVNAAIQPSEQTPPVSQRDKLASNPSVSPESSTTQAAPVEQVLTKIMNDTNRMTERLKRQAARSQAQQPQEPQIQPRPDLTVDAGAGSSVEVDPRTMRPLTETTGSSNIGELRRADQPEVARIQRLQAEEVQRSAPLAPTADYMGTLTPQQRNTRAAQLAAQRASGEQQAELKAQQQQPELDRLTNEYRQRIRSTSGLNKWLMEGTASGTAGLEDLAAGIVRSAKYNPLAPGAEGTADKIALHAQALQRAAELEGADRNWASKTVQNALSGAISTAPELAAMSAGVPAPVVFGAGAGLRAAGQGMNTKEVLKQTGRGIATAAAFDAPVPAGITGKLGRAATKGTLVGGTTGAIDLASGESPSQAASSAITNTLFGAYGELRHGGSPRQGETGSGKEWWITPQEQSAPTEVQQAAARLRGASDELFRLNFTISDTQRSGGDIALLKQRHSELLSKVLGEEQALKQQGYKVNLVGEVVRQGDEFPRSFGSEDYRGERPSDVGGVPKEQYSEVQGEAQSLAEAQNQQLRPTETTPFKRWFGESQVRDEMGEPLVVYHGTQGDFGAFEGSKVGRRHGESVGFHFTNDPKTASVYAGRVTKTSELEGELRKGAGDPLRRSVVMPVYLKIDHPLKLSSGPKEPSEYLDANRSSILASIEKSRQGSNPYDGVIITASDGSKSYVAFEPSQIKSAIGNRGTFDPSNPDITDRAVGDLPSQGIPQRFYYRDFGEVTESPDQQGVRKGQVRVTEADGTEHVVQRPSGTGAGNQRAVPLRPELITEQSPERVPEVQVEGERPVTPPASGPTPESATSARKAQFAEDRAQFDLPELPPAERKSWQRSLDEAKPEQATRLADEVLNRPRALSDSETVSLVVRAQQVKNEHAAKLKEIGEVTDNATIAQKRAELDTLEREFDRLTQAAKKSGTEKGRTLAAQKLTINQDYDLISMKARLKAAKGDALTDAENARVEDLHRRLAKAEADLSDANEKLAQRDLQKTVDRIARRERRTQAKQSLDEEFAQLKQQFAQARAETRGVQASGLAGLDPEGRLTKLIGQMARNRIKAGVTDAAQLVDDIHAAISEHLQGVTKRDIRDVISGYGREPQGDRRSDDAKRLADIRTELRKLSESEDIAAGRRLSARDSVRQKQLQKQQAELERRIGQKDFSAKPRNAPPAYSPETLRQQEQVARIKREYERSLRRYELENRSKPEKAADFLIRWGRAAKLSYVSTLGKLSSAATGRMVMSPLENLVGEIPHRLSPELSRRATTEGGGFDRAAEVAGLWKSGRFRQVLNQLTRGSSDLDVLYGKGLDKEMQSEGILGIPGRVHGALKEYPRQAEFDRAFVKVLKNYDQQGRDIGDPAVQLAARMEAYNSAERARFQQHNFISDTFNSAMGALERQGLAGKVVAKTGRFIFPITRVPVNVVGETLNYAFGSFRAPIETAIRGGVKNLTPEQANNIMRAYKKGGLGLAVMTYAFLNPQQFGGYYQRGDQRDENEPKPGEVMFFGVRVPKALTHIPIIEAGQLAATVRRVMDKLTTKGESKSDAVAGGVTAGAKGLAAGVPFYETPARFFTGQEGPRGVAQAAGEQVRGMIPGFVQEGAQLLDRDAQGKPIRRTPKGSFSERFGQTVELGIPGLRRNVPESPTRKSEARDALTRQARTGDVSDADLRDMVQQGELTEADRKLISRHAKLNERQVRFESAVPSTALDRFERMDAGQQEEVRDIMERKAYTLLHSDSLTDEQKEAFAARIDAAGLEPKSPRARAGGFKSAFR